MYAFSPDYYDLTVDEDSKDVCPTCERPTVTHCVSVDRASDDTQFLKLQCRACHTTWSIER